MDQIPHSVRIYKALGYLWKKKGFVVLGTSGVTAAGLAYSLLAHPVYTAHAVIYPQDVSVNAEKASPLGGFTGALNPLQGVSHLSRVELILNSRATARQVLINARLLPVFFPQLAAKGQNDSEINTASNLNSGVDMLASMVSTHADLYKLTLEISTKAGDASTAFRVTQAYLQALDDRLKSDVVGNADANRDFLEAQMARTSDPWSKEKIQDLVIRETERAMLLNASAFDVLEAPEEPLLRDTPKRKQIVLYSLLIGFAGSCFAVLALRGFRNLRREAEAFDG